MINALISNPSFQLSAAVWKANMQKKNREMGRRLVWMIEEQKERREVMQTVTRTEKSFTSVFCNIQNLKSLCL